MSIWSLLVVVATVMLQVVPPKAPENRHAVQTGRDEVTLTWDAQSGVGLYRILVDEGKGLKPLETIGGNATRYVARLRPDAKQTVDTTLTFWIEPTGRSGKDAGSRAAFNPVRLETLYLTAPENRRAVQTGRDEVTLTWDAKSGVPMYRILLDDGRGAKLLGTIGGNGTRYVARLTRDTNGIGDRPVTFSIQPADPRGRESGTSATFNPVTIEPVPSGPMHAPRRVTAELTGDTITVRWDAVQGAKGYAILRDSGRLGFQPLCAMCPADTSFVDRDFVKGQKHTYAVSAIGLQGRSGPARSEPVDTRALRLAEGPGSAYLASPGNARATVIGKEVELTWSAVPRAAGYVIHLDRRTVARTGANTMRFRHAPGLPGPLQYDVEATTTDEKGNSAPTRFNEVTIEGAKTGGGVTPPGGGRGGTAPGGTPPGPVGKVPDAGPADEVSPPTNLKAALNGTTVQLSWTAPRGVRGYQIRRNGRVVGNLGRTATSWSEAVGHMAGEQLRYEIVALGGGPPSAPAAFNPVTVPRTTIPKR